MKRYINNYTGRTNVTPERRAVITTRSVSLSSPALRARLRGAQPAAPIISLTNRNAIAIGKQRTIKLPKLPQAIRGVDWRLINWRYAHFHTVGPLIIAVLLLIIMSIFQLFHHDFYQLQPVTKSLIGPVNTQLIRKLTYDATQKSYQYNKKAESSGNLSNPQTALAAADKAQHVGGGSDNYAIELATIAQNGITVRDTTDTSGEMAITLTPLFKARDGKLRDGRVIYPLKGYHGQLVYSVKANGLKEDLIIPADQGDTASFSYHLKLPSSLEARLQTNGGIGIYSADPALFGNITYGSSVDRQKVEAARTHSVKNHLVFALPAPQITQTGKGSDQAKASFELKDNTLTVKTTGLSHATYPLSIDPSVAVLSATDLTKGNFEGNINLNGSNQLIRGSLTGATLSAGWTPSGNLLSTNRFGQAVTVYNGNIYLVGGNDGTSFYSDVYFSTIGALGSINAWSDANAVGNGGSGNSFGTADGQGGRNYANAVTYNGYLYVIAGNTGPNGLANIDYAKINANGSLGSWQTTTSLATARYGSTSVAYNGNLYVIGGCTESASVCTGSLNTVVATNINGDGSLGATWISTTFPIARALHSSVVYNGYIYIIGGSTNGGNTLVSTNIVEAAPVNADGTLGSWFDANAPASGGSGGNTGSGLSTIVYKHSSVIYNGYLYVIGGSSATPTAQSSVQYAPINANGSLGVWNTTTGFTTARDSHTSVAYNGYIYVIGGQAGTSGTGCTGTSNTCNTTQYAKIDLSGVTGTYTTNASNYNATARYGTASVAYNGCLYVIGGSLSGGAVDQASILDAAIGSDGSLSGWATNTNNYGTARSYLSAVAYGGYLYVVGGKINFSGTYSNEVNYAALTGSCGTGATGVFTTGNSLLNPQANTGRASVGLTAANGSLYMSGGVDNNNSSLLADTQYSVIGASGVPGIWTNTNSFLNTGGNGRSAFGMTASGGYVYIAGGREGIHYCAADACGDVQYAPINANGSLGTWADANTSSGGSGSSFSTARMNLSAVAYNGYLYIAGGSTAQNSGMLSDTQYAPINANGTLGTWRSTVSFSTARIFQSAVAYNGMLYEVGGCSVDGAFGNCNSSGGMADIQYAPINNGGPGTISSSWTSSGNTFLNARGSPGAVAYNGYIYVLGGKDSGSTYYNDVQYASISADGTVGTWANANTGASFTARSGLGIAVYNGYIYILGGEGGTGTTYYNDVQYASINANGTVGTWANANTGASFSGVRGFATAVANNGYIYILGGYSGSTDLSDVQYASINANGTIGSWTTTASFATGRRLFGGVVYNGYIYILGGYSNGTFLNDVQYAKINANGSLLNTLTSCPGGALTNSTWCSTTSFNGVRDGLATVASNGYVYIMGGYNGVGSTRLNDVQFAPINANGTVGNWSNLTNLSLGRAWFPSALYNGRIYILGGDDGTSSRNDVQYVSQLAIPRVGRYSYLFDLAGNAVPIKLLYNGTLPTAGRIGLATRGGLSSTATFGSITTANSLIPGTLFTFTPSEQRYFWLQFTLDDSQNTAFPDSLSTPQTVSGFQSWFHPAPTGHLRHGKTFTNGSLNSQDTTPN